MKVDAGRILEAGGSDHVAMEGMSWYEQGCVKWIDARYGSVVGVVEERLWTYRKVWVGIENGLLTFDCDDCLLVEQPFLLAAADDEEEPEPSDRLCRHAVAVALQAEKEGALWYELPTGAAADRPELHKDADPFLQPGRGTLLSRLSGDENGLLLQSLLEKRPELVGELEHLAVAQLDEVSVPAVAQRTRQALEAFLPEELPAYLAETDGKVSAEHFRESGDDIYADADEALLDYSLRPLVEDIARRFSAGAERGACAVALGVIKGLYDDRDHPRWTHPFLAEYVNGDILSTNAHLARKAVREWGADLGNEELHRVCPEWAEGLTGER